LFVDEKAVWQVGLNVFGMLLIVANRRKRTRRQCQIAMPA